MKLGDVLDAALKTGAASSSISSDGVDENLKSHERAIELRERRLDAEISDYLEDDGDDFWRDLENGWLD